MAQPYLGEIRAFGFTFAPKGWALCNGQLLPINQNQALFSLLGVTFGGDGIRTFQLPNLQASMPVHMGNGFDIGSLGGQSTHTLLVTEIPTHTHQAQGVSTTANSSSATDATWGASTQNPYINTQNTSMAANAVSPAGGGQPHDNMAPYLVLNYCIALAGIYPSRS
jgi:microcystin-dependent protein